MEYLFEVALTDDERGRRKEAESLYSSAIEFAIEAVSKSSTIHFYINVSCFSLSLSLAKEDWRSVK